MMDTQPSQHDIELDLDRIHELARTQFLERNIDAYMSIFSKQLSYRQLDGRVIGVRELSKDVTRQFRSVSAADWMFIRKSITVENGRPIEELIQTGYMATTAFGFCHRISSAGWPKI